MCPPAVADDRSPALGCHRRRIPDRAVFEKLVQILVFGCGYRRIADATCSSTTLRRRRDEWIALGLAEQLRLAVLAAYDRLFGLELDHLVVDGCITKAPCGGQVARPSPGLSERAGPTIRHGGGRRPQTASMNSKPSVAAGRCVQSSGE